MLELDNTHSLDKKLLILAVFMFTCILVLAGGLWRVQILSSKEYEQQMLKQYSVSVRVPAVRGKILDRDGKSLADNRPSFTVNLYLEELRELYQEEYVPVKDQMYKTILEKEGKERRLTSGERAQINKDARFNVMQRLINKLSLIMEEDLSISAKTFENHYNRQLSMPLAVMTDISLRHTTRFLEAVDMPPGFDLDTQPIRTYPQNDLASQTLGYMTRMRNYSGNDEPQTKYQLPDYAGVAGLEGYFEEELRGKPGVKNITVNYLGYRTGENITVEPTPGKNIHLTLDSDIQRAAQEALLRGNPDRKGAVVVMDSSSGDLLAMASAPGYNPNDFIPKISTEKWLTINPTDDPSLKKLRNRCHAERYQPGSIYKIAVALTLLESDDFDPEEELSTSWIYTYGTQPNQIRIRDTAPPGQYNFVRAFKKSSNYYFVEKALKIGRRPIIEFSKGFGFDQPTDLPLLQSATGIIPTDEYISKHRLSWTLGRTANLAIGQGEIDLTPLHISQMMACIANGGRIPKPRLVTKIESNQFNNKVQPIEFFPTQDLNYIPLKERSIEYLKQAMLADVADSDGTGRRAFVEGMDIGGKTGTAESRKKKTTWFASMAPIQNPRFIVVVMAENDFNGSGGSTCAPIARNVYLAIKKKYYTVASPADSVSLPPMTGVSSPGSQSSTGRMGLQ